MPTMFRTLCCCCCIYDNRTIFFIDRYANINLVDSSTNTDISASAIATIRYTISRLLFCENFLLTHFLDYCAIFVLVTIVTDSFNEHFLLIPFLKPQPYILLTIVPHFLDGSCRLQIRAGTVALLYVSPERFNNERFVKTLKGIKVALFVVDEAHCISEV